MTGQLCECDEYHGVGEGDGESVDELRNEITRLRNALSEIETFPMAVLIPCDFQRGWDAAVFYFNRHARHTLHGNSE